MQTEAHGHLVVFNSIFEAFMLCIVANVLKLIDSSEDLEEGED